MTIRAGVKTGRAVEVDGEGTPSPKEHHPHPLCLQEPTPEALSWFNMTWPLRNAVETQWTSLTFPHSLVSPQETSLWSSSLIRLPLPKTGGETL